MRAEEARKERQRGVYDETGGDIIPSGSHGADEDAYYGGTTLVMILNVQFLNFSFVGASKKRGRGDSDDDEPESFGYRKRRTGDNGRFRERSPSPL